MVHPQVRTVRAHWRWAWALDHTKDQIDISIQPITPLPQDSLKGERKLKADWVREEKGWVEATLEGRHLYANMCKHDSCVVEGICFREAVRLLRERGRRRGGSWCFDRLATGQSLAWGARMRSTVQQHRAAAPRSSSMVQCSSAEQQRMRLRSAAGQCSRAVRLRSAAAQCSSAVRLRYESSSDETTSRREPLQSRPALAC